MAQDAETQGDQTFQGSGRPEASRLEIAVRKRESGRFKQENETLKKRRHASRGNCREVRMDPGTKRLWRAHASQSKRRRCYVRARGRGQQMRAAPNLLWSGRFTAGPQTASGPRTSPMC